MPPNEATVVSQYARRWRLISSHIVGLLAGVATCTIDEVSPMINGVRSVGVRSVECELSDVLATSGERPGGLFEGAIVKC